MIGALRPSPGEPPAALSGGAWAAGGVVLTLLAATLVPAAVRLVRDSDLVEVGSLALFCVVSGSLAVVVLRQRPGSRVGRLLLVQALCAAVAGTSAVLDQNAIMSRVTEVAWFPAFAMMPLVLVDVLPREPGAFRRRLSVCLGALVIAGTAAALVSVSSVSDEDILARRWWPDHGVGNAAATVFAVTLLLCGFVMLAEVVVLLSLAVGRRRGSNGIYMRLGLAVAAMLVGIVLDALGIGGAWVVGVLAFPVALLWTGFTDHLYDIDLLVSRTVASLLGWAGLITGCGITIWVISYVVLREPPELTAVATSVAVGLTAAPVFHRARRGIGTVLYGHRDDPLTILGQIGRPITAGTPDTPTDDILRAIAAGISIGMAIPYVRLTLTDGTIVEAGRAGCPPAASFPMRYRGCELGAIAVAPRSYHGRFSAADRRVLAALADQASVAIHAMLMARQLAETRGRVVAAREAERLQLRNDLHDGLGTALAGVALQLRAIGTNWPETRQAAEAAERDVAGCKAEVTSVIRRLRPPALRDGLISAVGEAAARLERAGTRVVFEHPETLPPAAPEVEMAAYRIVCEALTNAVRHGKARCCTVTIADDCALTLDVVDDGVGLDRTVPDDASSGVGLESMRERAAEVNGTLDVLPTAPHGTRVHAVLPWGSR
ncbi:putative two-component system sensor kinase [Actinoplanes missouriensis 431]|uniref:histidine kinase n=1 Tax=Actinoplanes missouriensis (strain ATCC 14538 / DSM 43046 / CBS 188.64 / JCM 3121 / NBRC 102363 / NCIMB 12654 / NRRL B-3342 / UNCC 431) TaxID=512565 RepID=I0HB15_ACTM4|nr:sensor histidine kinase [Actinoplanes missouriensis]BAL90202.1 putative two-component system sensor kinase [Actinoplanes missouriensis 431]